MKLKAILALTILLTTILCGCQSLVLSTPAPSTDHSTDPVITFDDQLAAEALTALVEAKSGEELATWLCDNSKDLADALLAHYQGRDVSVKAQYRTKFQDYDIFYFEMKDSSGEMIESGYCLFEKNGDTYLCCVNSEIQQAMLDAFRCKLCVGTGQINNSTWNVCGICGGVGTQYIPNAYFDPATNMWMGITQACGGCGGAGGFYSGLPISCANCGGDGFLIP